MPLTLLLPRPRILTPFPIPTPHTFPLKSIPIRSSQTLTLDPMKISELSPEYRQPPPHTGFIADLSTVVADAEAFDTSTSSAEKLATDFRRILTNLGSVSSSLTDACRIQIWKLATRLWNACVDRANSTTLARGPSARAAEAEIRQAAPELLLLAGVRDEIPLAAAKVANFFFRAGKEWLHLGRVDLATACFEKGTPLVSATGSEEERRVLLDLNLARARAASGAGDQFLAVALLSRSKPLASASPEGIKSLAEAYLSVGEATLSTKPSDPAVQASSILTEALDLCDKVASPSGASPKTPNLNELKGRCFRFLAVERIQANDHEGTLRCIRGSRASIGLAEEHPSMGVLAIRALLGSGNILEAERELERLMAKPEAPEHMCVMAAEEYLASAGPEAARKVLVALAARCRTGGAAAAVRVVTKVVQGGIGSTGRARAICELVSDERVAALFDGPANTIQRGAMHSLLWNCGAEHFNTKNYDTSADFYERSLLYLSREEESRPRRAQCLRRNDEEEAIKQMKTMVGCVDFNPEFLVLTTHEAIACKSVRVAVASLTYLLGLYPTGKPMPMAEVVVLRNLIEQLRREQGTEEEILKYSRHAKLRMSELGVEGFFGNGAVGWREINWFALSSWNLALRVTEEQKYDLSAEFYELAAEFFGGAT
uniref:Uncharacterized protein n=1 Tax=Avena sativa TaxID=4498 RepID=A0ACD5WJF0_AVESA